jgi:2-dehydro-3-deoxyphosphogluconate aldolase / (4S)-4-hydroxy-2-oxoglutarate aldolase
VVSTTGSTTLAELLGRQRVLPLLEVDDGAQAVELARILVEHGMPVMEIALRTPGAISAIEAVGSSVAGAVVGAGTVMSPGQLAVAAAAGAAFAVSPGSSAELFAAAADGSIPFVPGVATVSELMRVAETGIREAKFFPAEAAGGVLAVSAMGAVMPSMRFLPTGGINGGSARDYLAVDHVFAVGGSWMCPAALIHEGAWGDIADHVLTASTISSPGPA